MTVTVRPVPTPVPQASDPVNFDARADAFHAQFPGIVADMNSQNAENNSLAEQVNASAAAAAAASAAAQTYSAATVWAATTAYTAGQLAISPTDWRVYRRTAAGTSSTDPAADSTLWTPAGLTQGTGMPSLRPSLLLDFANTAQVDPRLVFGRTSTATRVNAAGLIETVPANRPRIDHDPATLACLGLLMEDQRTNLLTYSEQFDNAAWLKTNIAIVANQVVAPDGTTTGDQLTKSASFGRIYQRYASGNNTFTASVYAKAGTATKMTYLLAENNDNESILRVIIDLTTGGISYSIGSSGVTTTSVGNGWWRITLTATTTTATNVSFSIYEGVFNDTDFTGTVFIWGAQLEAGPSASSYIPTTAEQATRTADIAAMGGSNFSSWYRAGMGTLLADVVPKKPSVLTELIKLTQASNGNEKLSIYTLLSVTSISFLISKNNVNQMWGSFPIGQYGTRSQAVLAFAENDAAICVNGATPLADTECQIPTVDLLQLRGSGGPAHIRRLAYYPARVSNAQLQALTAL